MLRVRPIHYTSRMDQWEGLLSALGMVRTVNDGDWQDPDFMRAFESRGTPVRVVEGAAAPIQLAIIPPQ